MRKGKGQGPALGDSYGSLLSMDSASPNPCLFVCRSSGPSVGTLIFLSAPSTSPPATNFLGNKSRLNPGAQGGIKYAQLSPFAKRGKVSGRVRGANFV